MQPDAVSTAQTQPPPPPPPPDATQGVASTSASRDAALASATAQNDDRGRDGAELLGARTSAAPASVPEPTVPPGTDPQAVYRGMPASPVSAMPAVRPSAVTPPSAALAKSTRPPGNPVAETARGVMDGIRDTANGIKHTAQTAYRLATDAKFRGDIAKAAGAIREAIRTPEGQRLVGEALRDAVGAGAGKLMEHAEKNPAYAAGYLAGALLTGGALTKGVALLGNVASKLKPLGDVLKAASDVVQKAKGPALAAAAGGASALAYDADARKLAKDVAGTLSHAPAGVASLPILLTPQGRAALRAGMEHARDAARAQRPADPAPQQQ